MPNGSSRTAYIAFEFLTGDSFVAADEDEIVSVELAALAPGVIVAGEKAHSSPLGRPLQESVIALLNDPDRGVAVTVKFPVCPAGMVSEFGDALKFSDTAGGPAAVAHDGLY
jgi:hypothetical protein